MTAQGTRRRTAGLPVPVRAAAAVTVAVAAAAVTACGVRSTEVPVDAGAAPSRASCDTRAPQRTDGVAVVFLVCASGVQSVERAVDRPPPGEGRAALAAALLAELQSPPGEEEWEAGFQTKVPGDLEIVGPEPGAGSVVRLSRGLSELQPFARAQIICTFANDTALGNGDSVVLGGPAGGRHARAKTYACTMSMRESPESAPPLGKDL